MVCDFQVISQENVVIQFSGRVDEIRCISWTGQLQTVSDKPFVAGNGLMKINEGGEILNLRRQLESVDQTEGCDGYLFNGDQPCCTEKLFGNFLM